LTESAVRWKPLRKKPIMLLEHKTAIVYGAGGPIGSAVAQAFAAEGAHVHLAGRTATRLQPIAHRIITSGGRADVAQLDVLDQPTVERHARSVADAGGIDICFNAVANDDIQGTPLPELALAELLQPVTKAVTSHFIIATTVGRHMARRGNGVILCMAGGREAIPRLGGSHVAWSALAGLCRQLAADLGPHGIRVSWLLSPGSPDPDHAHQRVDEPTHGLLPRHQPTFAEVGRVAAFLASDGARTITAAEINLTGGAVVD
jgi:NAD(P)-dependent dehydrogenase (short-subunit alcohol dehydrogenase family)